MGDEQDEVEVRAARHAALGDASRLRIVDLLAVADYAPSELQVRLGMPSNLLAHHLGQLERAGLVVRSRSEADRRRTYIRLARDVVEGWNGSGSVLTPAPRVVFVCTANSARSQLAAALWSKASRVPVASAGTRPADRVNPGAIDAAERHGLRFAGRRPRLLSEVQGAGDLLVTVCDTAHEELGDIGLHWSIPDPVRIGTQAAFDAAFDQLRERITDLAPRVAAA